MIYFFLYFVSEVLVTTEVASRLGGLMMLAEIVFSAFIGMVILFNFRTTLIVNIMELRERRLDANSFYQRNLLGLLSAILLILPGILTDFMGVLIQFFLLSTLIVNRFKPKYPKYNSPTQPKDDNVIDAEIISDSPALR
jgi:UPF0716 family protein affecting phage T7 exclusion